MIDVWSLRLFIAECGIIIGDFVGAFDHLLYALVVFMVVDYITGLLVAVARQSLSSSIGFHGICKKVCILMLVGIANVIDVHIIKSDCVLRTVIACFYISNEGISIIENIGSIGLPIPERLRDVIQKLKEK